MEPSIVYPIKALILPPGFNALGGVLGLLLLWRFRKTGIFLILTSVVSLWVLSMPTVGRALAGSVESLFTPLLPEVAERWNAEAIVVLGGGRTPVAMPEYQGQTVNATTLERLRYAAELHRRYELPIAVAGGRVFGEGISEAQLMSNLMQEAFDINVSWLEDTSRNTSENAKASYQLLQTQGVKKIFLVTHALHMQRAEAVFRRAGFEVKAAPTMYRSLGKNMGFYDWLPEIKSLGLSRDALHEIIGHWWYRFWPYY